jgi:hypothetical protein
VQIVPITVGGFDMLALLRLVGYPRSEPVTDFRCRVPTVSKATPLFRPME